MLLIFKGEIHLFFTQLRNSIMNKITKSIISLVLIFIILSGCNQKDPSQENDLKYEIVSYEKQSEGCDGLREDNCAKIKIEFPQIVAFKDELIKEKINNSIKSVFSMSEYSDQDEIDFKAEMEEFIKDYESFISEFPESFQSWFIEKTGVVKLNRANILSIDYLDYSYTGGAHANTFVAFINYSLADGNEITLDDIIPPAKQEELTKIGEEEFRKLKELKQEADLGQAGFWFENNDFYLNDNFLITDSTLVFYYNNYEVTAYAFGPTELIIPYSSIKSLVDDNSLIKPLIE
jgi:hypothetical protein